MWSGVTPASAQTLSTNLVMDLTTACPTSDDSCSSKPDSASKLSLSARLKASRNRRSGIEIREERTKGGGRRRMKNEKMKR